MKVSTKGRYALRFMAQLATAEDGICVSLREIAQDQAISEKYLEQIVAMLVRAGLVAGVRGVQGGYHLTKPANEITVGDVLRVTEGDLSPVDCVADGGRSCERADNCQTLFVWQRLKEATDAVVDGITIADLAERDSTPCVADALGRLAQLD